MTTAAIYARLSDERGDEDSVDVQVRKLREEAERREFTVPDALVFEDRSRSATKRGGKRPAYDALVDALVAGKASTVLVRETSRLYRRPLELETLLDLMEGRGLTVIPLFSSEQKLDSALERNDLLVARIMVAVDAEEVAKLGKRVRMAKASRREAGEINGGGRRPYGYRRVKGVLGLTLEPAEVAIIREAAERVIAGESLNRISRDLNDRGVRTASGARWRPAHVRRILIGVPSEDRKRTTVLALGGGNWPAILTADEVAILTARLTAPSKFRTSGTTAGPTGRRYALTGLLECSECGSKLLGSGGAYRCMHRNGGCGRVSVNARQVEDLLDHRIQEEREAGNARDPATATTGGDPADRVDVLAELAEVERGIEVLAERLAESTSKTATRVTARAIEKLALREETARARLAALVPESPAWSYADLGVDSDWRERWVAGELTATELLDLHDTFAAYFTAVQVASRAERLKTLDPKRVKVQWRKGAR